MSYTSYKILAAQRLGLDPAELLSCYELRGRVLVTTPDGVQHIFTCETLDHPAPLQTYNDLVTKELASPQNLASKPAKKVAKKAPKGPGSPLFPPGQAAPEAIPVAKPKRIL